MHIAVSTKLTTEPSLDDEAIHYFLGVVADMPTLHAIGRMALNFYTTDRELARVKTELDEAQALIDKWRMHQQLPKEEPKQKTEPSRRHGWERRGTKRSLV